MSLTGDVVVVTLQLLSCVQLFATLWTAACQASQSFTISQSWLKLMSIELVMPSNHLILCCPLLLCLQSFPASGCFPLSQLFTSGDQNIGASASAWVLLMNIQGWFPLRLTGLLLMCPHSLNAATVQYSQDVSNHSFLEIDSNALEVLRPRRTSRCCWITENAGPGH